MNGEIVVAMERVSATYAEGGYVLPVLDDVSLAVTAGEIVALVGPSGCGKSTLLNIVAGLLDPDSGQVRIHGEPTRAADRLGNSAYMHQRDLLLPWRTALANAALALEVQGSGRSDARARAGQEFATFGLAGFEDRYPAQLSGGMRQRVAFVRTIVGGQDLLLLDEPFGALDALTRTEAQEWLGEALRLEPRTTMLVTHDVDEAVFLADRILVLSSRPGRVTGEERVEAPHPRPPEFRRDPEFERIRLSLLEQLGVIDHRGWRS